VHKSGRMFAVFGADLNDHATIRECLGMGVEIIFADCPDIARDTIDKWKMEQNESKVG